VTEQNQLHYLPALTEPLSEPILAHDGFQALNKRVIVVAIDITIRTCA